MNERCPELLHFKLQDLAKKIKPILEDSRSYELVNITINELKKSLFNHKGEIKNETWLLCSRLYLILSCKKWLCSHEMITTNDKSRNKKQKSVEHNIKIISDNKNDKCKDHNKSANFYLRNRDNIKSLMVLSKLKL